jgi:hypothetical protein
MRRHQRQRCVEMEARTLTLRERRGAYLPLRWYHWTSCSSCGGEQRRTRSEGESRLMRMAAATRQCLEESNKSETKMKTNSAERGSSGLESASLV